MIEDPFLNLTPAQPEGVPFRDIWTKQGAVYYAVYADQFWAKDNDGTWRKREETRLESAAA